MAKSKGTDENPNPLRGPKSRAQRHLQDLKDRIEDRIGRQKDDMNRAQLNFTSEAQ